MFDKIHSIVVKTVISVEPLLWNGVEMFVPNAYSFGSQVSTSKKNNNCFELLGFDIILDENFKPWLLEVNLSPSLSTDSMLDFRVKSNLMADLFNLVRLQNDEQQQNQIQKELQFTQLNSNPASNGTGGASKRDGSNPGTGVTVSNSGP